jgi:hypothetical protein
MQACYAFNRSKHITQRILPGDGLIGQAFLEKETVYLKDVPDQFVRITSGLGEANPRHVLIVPLKMNETIGWYSGTGFIHVIQPTHNFLCREDRREYCALSVVVSNC